MWSPFGRWTGAALLLLGALAVWRSQSEERAFLVSASLFVIAYTLMTALFDEAEVLRHALQYRVLTNTLLLWCGWVVLRSLTVSVRELVARRG